MLKAKGKVVSLLTACLTAIFALVLGFASLFAPTPITTANAAETTYSYTFTAKQFSANGTKTLSDVDWTLAGDGGYWGYDGTKGQQLGSGGNPYKTLTLTSAEFSNVSEIVINTSGASSINATFTVSVGNEQVGDSTKLTTSATTYTFTPNSSLPGAVKFSYTQTSSKAIYIKSITITYEEGSSCEHDYKFIQENGMHKEVCSLCGEDKEGTSWVACDGDLEYTTLETGANGTHQKVGSCSTCGADLSTSEEPCTFEESIDGTTKTYTCECGNSYEEEVTPRTITFSYPNNVTLNGDASITSADGEVITLPTTTNPDEYIFLGWSAAKIEGSTETKPTTYTSWTVNGDATLYAVYQKDVQPGGWNLVTDVTDLATGDIVTIAAPTSNVAIGSKSNTSTVYFTTIELTSAGNVLTSNNALTQLTVTKNINNANQFAFKTETGTNYLSWSSGNSLTTSSSEYYWTVAISDSQNAAATTSIKSAKDSSRILQYNASSPRFACYTSGQTAVALYKYSEGEPISYVTTFCEHDGEKTTETINPTCTEKGLETVTCNNCGAQISTTEIPAKGHGETTTTTLPATCTVAGSITVTCDDCGATLSTEAIPATGHNLDAGVITTEPQIGAEGEKTYTCQNGCGYTETESIPALDAETFVVSYSVPEGIPAVTDSEAVTSGETVILKSAENKLGYTFVGWVENELLEDTMERPEILAAGSEYTVTENVTLYALYTYSTGSGNYVKVTETPADWSGTYLIVYEDGADAYIFNGVDAVKGYVKTTTDSATIAANNEIDAVAVTIATMEGGYSILTSGGYCFGKSGDNALEFNASNPQLNTISLADDGVSIISNTSYLRFNSASNQMRFRYYKDSSYEAQKAIQLYALDAGETYYTTALTSISYATLTVGESLTMNYYVTTSADLTDATMSFTMNEKTVDVTGVEVDGKYKFSLEIPPQCMADNISAVLKLGSFILDVKENYSVQEYAQNKLNDNPSDELKQLLTDMLYYGAAAQNYTGYNTENLANVGVENIGTPSTEKPTSTDFTLENAAVDSYPVYFKSASLWFGNVNKIRISLSSFDENVSLTINGEEVELTGETVLTEGILATYFDETYTFELSYNGVVMQTLTYSINAFVYEKQNSDSIGELALALYRYGLAAVDYKNA